MTKHFTLSRMVDYSVAREMDGLFGADGATQKQKQKNLSPSVPRLSPFRDALAFAQSTAPRPRHCPHLSTPPEHPT